MKPITNRLGSLLPPAMTYAGYVVLIFGVVACLDQPLIGIPIALLGAVMALGSVGIQLDPEKKEYRNYSNLLGIKLGGWQSYKTYPDMTVMRVNESSQAHSMTNRTAETSSETYYDICLLTANHRKRITIKRFTDKEEAKAAGTEYAELLGVNLTNFNPPVSAKTKARKAARR